MAATLERHRPRRHGTSVQAWFPPLAHMKLCNMSQHGVARVQMASLGRVRRSPIRGTWVIGHFSHIATRHEAQTSVRVPPHNVRRAVKCTYVPRDSRPTVRGS